MYQSDVSDIVSRINRNAKLAEYNNMSLTTFEAGRDIFCQALTDDGSDATLNENYSGGATACYWTATTYPAVINRLNILAVDSDVAQNTLAPNPELMCGMTLTNGYKLKTLDAAAATEITLIASGCTNESILSRYCSEFNTWSNTTSATTGNNFLAMSASINFRMHFGFGLYIPAGGKIVMTLEDDFSGLALHSITVSGFYLVTGDQVT